MTTFPTLREFMLLRESYDGANPRPLLRNDLLLTGHGDPWVIKDGGYKTYAADIVLRYDIAKASWEKWGDECFTMTGIPVLMLWAGHGGGVGVVRVFDGLYEEDERFFAVSRLEENNKGRLEKSVSLVDRKTWWAHMQAVADSGWRP